MGLTPMETVWLVSYLALWALVLFLGFLLLGTLRMIGLLSWRLEQLQAVTPSRLGRDGLKPGKRAPDFTLPAVAGGETSLHDFAGRKVLLVFVQGGCGPCHRVVPELNKRHRKGGLAVLAVCNGGLEAARKWAADVKAAFPLLAQEQVAVSKRYQVFATPFAFLIDEKGVIASKGIVNNGQHVGYVLAGPQAGVTDEQTTGEPHGPEEAGSEASGSPHLPKEVSHV